VKNSQPYLLLTILAFVCFTTNAQVRFNGNFEWLDSLGRPIGWDLRFYDKSTFDVKLDSITRRQGKYSLSISSGTSNLHFGAINFPIHQVFFGKTLTLIGSIKTENVKDGYAGLWVSVEDARGKSLSFDNMESHGVSGTKDWKEYMIQVPYPQDDAAKINIGALLVGKGKMWVDSLRIYFNDTPIENANILPLQQYAALKDTTFCKRSGVNTMLVNSKKVASLAILGQIWGFLKYHHPMVAMGKYNWDAELFRLLPSLLKCGTHKQASDLLEKWIDHLGTVHKSASYDLKPKIRHIAIRPEYGSLFTNTVISKTLTRKLKFILANANNQHNFYVTADGGPPEFRNENSYAEADISDAGYRLLALYRYWSAIQYFYPSRHLIKNWDNVLFKYIPQVLRACNKVAYTKVMIRLICEIHDTHAFVVGDAVDIVQGRFRIPVQARFIENKLVVTGYYKDTLDIKNKFKIGDVIEYINGIPVQKLIIKSLPYTSASNFATQLRDLPGTYLLRSNNPYFNIILNRDRKKLTCNVRAIDVKSFSSYDFDYHTSPFKRSYTLLNKDIGYVFAGNYRNDSLSAIKRMFAGTKGIIIDMRCYPLY
jgi:hypothetical protein